MKALALYAGPDRLTHMTSAGLTHPAGPDHLTHMVSAGLTHPAGTQPGGDSYVICVYAQSHMRGSRQKW